MFSSNEQFVNSVKSEVFSDKVYVYTSSGNIIELPKGSTIVDFAYKVGKEEANKMIGALVNDKSVSFDYVLSNKDRIKIILDEFSKGPIDEWIGFAQTSYAKKLIKEYKKN